MSDIDRINIIRTLNGVEEVDDERLERIRRGIRRYINTHLAWTAELTGEWAVAMEGWLGPRQYASVLIRLGPSGWEMRGEIRPTEGTSEWNHIDVHEIEWTWRDGKAASLSCPHGTMDWILLLPWVAGRLLGALADQAQQETSRMTLLAELEEIGLHPREVP